MRLCVVGLLVLSAASPALAQNATVKVVGPATLTVPGSVETPVTVVNGRLQTTTTDSLDTLGNPVPTYKAHAYGYDGSGNLATDTVTDGTNTWVRTYTTGATGRATDSGWVRQ